MNTLGSNKFISLADLLLSEMDTLRGLNYARQAKNTVFKFTDDAGNAQIASYVRIYLYVANTSTFGDFFFVLLLVITLCYSVLILLGVLAVFFQHWLVGLLSV